jgi:hypothetical protein
VSGKPIPPPPGWAGATRSGPTRRPWWLARRPGRSDPGTSTGAAPGAEASRWWPRRLGSRSRRRPVRPGWPWRWRPVVPVAVVPAVPRAVVRRVARAVAVATAKSSSRWTSPPTRRPTRRSPRGCRHRAGVHAPGPRSQAEPHRGRRRALPAPAGRDGHGHPVPVRRHDRALRRRCRRRDPPGQPR